MKMWCRGDDGTYFPTDIVAVIPRASGFYIRAWHERNEEFWRDIAGPFKTKEEAQEWLDITFSLAAKGLVAVIR